MFIFDEEAGEFTQLAIELACGTTLHGRAEGLDPDNEVVFKQRPAQGDGLIHGGLVLVFDGGRNLKKQGVEKFELDGKVIRQVAEFFIHLEAAFIVQLDQRLS